MLALYCIYSVHSNSRPDLEILSLF